MSKKICFTVCSLNRIGQAIVLFKSFLEHNPSYEVYIGLADEINERIDPTVYLPIQFIPLSQLYFKKKEYVTHHYNIFQICCALKPYFAIYFLTQLHADILIYLDTDIYVYDSFQCVELALDHTSIVLTPHILYPINFDDNKKVQDIDILSGGVFNIGFIAFKAHTSSLSFLEWWGERVAKHGDANNCPEQIWLNLVPIFFSEYLYILKEEGMNVAYWNLQERLLSEKEGHFFCKQ